MTFMLCSYLSDGYSYSTTCCPNSRPYDGEYFDSVITSPINEVISFFSFLTMYNSTCEEDVNKDTGEV